MLKTLQKNKFYLIAVLTVMLSITFLINQRTARPEDCILCGSQKYHAPCIVNLFTGEVGELTIYAPHSTLVGEIAEEQPGGTFSVFPCGGQKAVLDSDARTCSVQLPESIKMLKNQFFCKHCRELLMGMRGFALADLYDPNKICVYPVRDGAEYIIRGYTVSVEWNDGQECFQVVNCVPAP